MSNGPKFLLGLAQEAKYLRKKAMFQSGPRHYDGEIFKMTHRLIFGGHSNLIALDGEAHRITPPLGASEGA